VSVYKQTNNKNNININMNNKFIKYALESGKLKGVEQRRSYDYADIPLVDAVSRLNSKVYVKGPSNR